MSTSAVIDPLLAIATAVRLELFAGFFSLPFFFCAFDDRLGAAWSSTGKNWSVIWSESHKTYSLTSLLQRLLCNTSNMHPLAAVTI